ncbi:MULTISPECIES: MarR family winged helix-turn-helix transcriptional regulator [unclassified Streptomyces]|uniref:MarR family winged helix-turn-helix transcriptional regulator n=1 Tax=unclassified Streptomyces TaxID=2593676 RepID=UPI002257F976|nr:MarR family transcriptional regulator [Streptomyces sp. NBC_01500]MCX4549401.1 MarR family transcriptional regulator [Streptomyces sp. NBC_01500]WSV54945.1 MarR family transcriptional regulator [Streptomyces sp. NBC_01014]
MDVEPPASGPPTSGPSASGASASGAVPRTDGAGDIRDQLRQLTLSQQRFERHLGRELRVDPAGLAVMDHLVTVGPTTPTDLARRLEASTAATTLVIDRLVAAGHVSRQPHPTDRRKVIVTPADHWEATAYQYVSPLVEGVTAAAEALPPGEQATVAGFLRKIVGVYDEATRI